MTIEQGVSALRGSSGRGVQGSLDKSRSGMARTWLRQSAISMPEYQGSAWRAAPRAPRSSGATDPPTTPHPPGGMRAVTPPRDVTRRWPSQMNDPALNGGGDGFGAVGHVQ